MFDPWVRKIPWRREWLPILVFFPGESHGQGRLAGYSPWGCKALDMTEQLIHMLPLRCLSECRSSSILGPFFQYGRDFPVAQTVKNLPARQETRVRSLGWEVPLEEGMAIHSLENSCLENPHGQRSLAGYSPWGCKESDMTK